MRWFAGVPRTVPTDGAEGIHGFARGGAGGRAGSAPHETSRTWATTKSPRALMPNLGAFGRDGNTFWRLRDTSVVKDHTDNRDLPVRIFHWIFALDFPLDFSMVEQL